eukprot:9478741-Pyramimonas_sp.AAC.2
MEPVYLPKPPMLPVSLKKRRGRYNRSHKLKLNSRGRFSVLYSRDSSDSCQLNSGNTDSQFRIIFPTLDFATTLVCEVNEVVLSIQPHELKSLRLVEPVTSVDMQRVTVPMTQEQRFIHLRPSRIYLRSPQSRHVSRARPQCASRRVSLRRPRTSTRCAAVSDNLEKERASYSALALYEWMGQFEDFDSCGLALRDFGDVFGWGAVAERPFAATELVVKVPKAAFMTAQTARDSEICGEVARGLNEWQVNTHETNNVTHVTVPMMLKARFGQLRLSTRPLTTLLFTFLTMGVFLAARRWSGFGISNNIIK